LKIAVIGAGVTGSYLLNRLDGHEVECFEMRPQEKWYTVCAWGTSAPYITDLVKMAGFNFEDYILHRGHHMIVDYGTGTFEMNLRGLVTYDKHRLCEDMLRGHTIHWGSQVKQLDVRFDDFDLVVDATGMHRSLLPKVHDDHLVPCVEYQVKSSKLPYDDFYIRPYPGLSGYFWYFPLGNGMAHIGAGELHGKYKGEVEAFLKKYDCEVIRKIGRPVRIVPPAYCGPFYVEGQCKSCGRKVRPSRILSGQENIADREAVGSGSNSDQSASALLTNLGGSVTSAEAAIDSNFTTRNMGRTSKDTRIIETAERPIAEQSSRLESTSPGSRPSVFLPTDKSRGYSTIQSKGGSYCNCPNPVPDRPTVVGVGESIGTVYPLLGEGIIPSMECANIFVDNLHDVEAYSEEVLKHFDIYAKVFRIVKAKLDGNFSLVRQFPELFAMYRHMKSNERRYGLETRLVDMFNVVRG
jgi:flavin-dependent dehydrogenase